MPSSHSLQVFVRFKEDTVFAGEDVECTITFKNVKNSSKRGPPDFAPQETGPILGRPLDHLNAIRSDAQIPFARRNSLAQPRSQAIQKAASLHRQTSSFSVVDSAIQQPNPEIPGRGFQIANAAPPKKHGRTVSIISIGGAGGHTRPTIKHGRSASVQAGPDSRGLGPARPRLGMAIAKMCQVRVAYTD